MKKRRLRALIENEQEFKHIKLKHMRILRAAVNETLEYECFGRDAEVSILLTDNENIREINSEYRKIDSPTDVLSFPQFAPGEAYPDTGYVPIGDIIISVERADFQANLYGHSFEREIAFLAVHSTLHLLGYDHVTSEEDEMRMREKQRDIMERLGLTVKEKENDTDAE